MGKDKIIKVSAGNYRYKGYNIRCHGYYAPDRCVWWEAINEQTQCADYHFTTLRQIINEIDQDDKNL